MTPSKHTGKVIDRKVGAGAETEAEAETIVTAEVRDAAAKVMELEDDAVVIRVLRWRQKEVVVLVKNLLKAADMDETLQISTKSYSPEEVLKLCLEQLKADFQRGIVVIGKDLYAHQYADQLQIDKSAGTTWEAVQARLLAKNGALLKRAATMQGGGELIGVYKDGKVCIIDRSDEYGIREPVIIAFDAKGNIITITTDTPNKDKVIKAIVNNGGRFANYWETRLAVRTDGFRLPPSVPRFQNIGLVKAAEAVNGKPFVSSKHGKERTRAILECGDVQIDAPVAVVVFNPSDDGGCGRAHVIGGNPCYSGPDHGVVRVLIG